jgi:single-strand DNA-binding protein
MTTFNKISIVGFVGRDPQLRFTPEGTPICNFSIATTERRKDKSGETQETVTWFQVALFGRQAEVASEYLAKGSLVYVEGSLTQREWTDRDGAVRYNLSVRGSDIKFIQSNQKAMAAAATPAPEPQPDQEAAQADDIPF